MPFKYILLELWHWIAETGINLALLCAAALLVPRAGRFINRYFERQVARTGSPDEGKTRLALVGAGVYIGEIIAYFLLLLFALQQIGFSLAGAAIPATVVSAAIGFGAQNIIADFLAGFFILTEKQYGVGDYVTFQGNGVDVSGDVIQLTMRATQIRTIEQATISIPNSTARVCINQSNSWSNALVVIPVPLLGSSSAEEVVARSERATRKALAAPEIAPKVQADLQVHPAVDIHPPATVGSPWTVDMRFMVKVEPLSQWMIERAIRLAILNEFWEEYGSAATIDGTLSPSPADPEATAVAPAVHLSPDPDEDPAAEPPTRILEPADEEDTESSSPRGLLDGLMRVSTFALLVVFAVLLLIRGFMVQPGEDSEANSGVLAPPARSSASVTESAVAPTYVPEEPTYATEPTYSSEVTTQLSTPSPTSSAASTTEVPPSTEVTPQSVETQPTESAAENTEPY
ncbi:mechanosensitive ion channel [Corynebacterium imitans]|uniref:mechanosensitive ion channel family protein n=1 Tax=Corynebacterium imitans TaxID=156978 RepID=UPI00254A6351|nr:mechanosensitive ion channel domain-containing protein [Corynebacterium imitans]MDK8306032.1 mechanosensitive ion channel [Corynebacterium imitans]MDK8636863.1 mechanosensitive ion channel [Corynebacterium imitans]MDK8772059.1 mechanosensitive ion channel [Corynebacterium imitans]